MTNITERDVIDVIQNTGFNVQLNGVLRLFHGCHGGTTFECGGPERFCAWGLTQPIRGKRTGTYRSKWYQDRPVRELCLCLELQARVKFARCKGVRLAVLTEGKKEGPRGRRIAAREQVFILQDSGLPLRRHSDIETECAQFSMRDTRASLLEDCEADGIIGEPSWPGRMVCIPPWHRQGSNCVRKWS